ncbi:hypothetical protein [Vibrio sp. 10N]|uniref:hypothetical protein n=1 Tax=Vibrio sp. 10N TaxID=3058938 RepID=UPI002812FE8E|nr:hypothetical protein VB10N_32380 [Vibrio sp. 10N]
MTKWFPLIAVMSLSLALILGVTIYFFGMQAIVTTASEWKNSWLVIMMHLLWFFSCLFIAIYSIESFLTKVKMHFTRAV